MTVRHTLLAVGAVLVMGIAIYLVREVSRTPSDAQAQAKPEPAPPPTAPREDVRPVEPPPRAVIPSAPKQPPPPTEVVVAPTQPNPTQQAIEVSPPEHAEISMRANPKLDAVMAEANRAYDQGDFDEAKQIAQKVLAKSPGNVRMLRIIVSSECIGGDSAEAQKYFAQLPVADRAQMRTRCDRYGVTLKDP